MKQFHLIDYRYCLVSVLESFKNLLCVCDYVCMYAYVSMYVLESRITSHINSKKKIFFIRSILFCKPSNRGFGFGAEAILCNVFIPSSKTATKSLDCYTKVWQVVDVFDLSPQTIQLLNHTYTPWTANVRLESEIIYKTIKSCFHRRAIPAVAYLCSLLVFIIERERRNK